MKEELIEVKSAIYRGMYVYDLIKNLEISIEGEILSINDKKILGLYLGLTNMELNIVKLDINKYLNIYSKYFTYIFKEINFYSIDSYIDYLLSKDIIKKYNRVNNIKNKQLIKN